VERDTTAANQQELPPVILVYLKTITDTGNPLEYYLNSLSQSIQIKTLHQN